MKKSPASSDLIPFPRRSEKAPVIFMVQPKGFKRITTPEQLKLWEQWMIERVGFSAESPLLAASRSANLGTTTGIQPAYSASAMGLARTWDD